MNAEELQAEIDEINSLTQFEMARLWRFAPAGHRYFDSTKPLHAHFKARFEKLGGMTPEISKRLGWHR